MSKMVYADNAATTALSKNALDAMMPYLTEQYGNPSSIYKFSQNSKRAIDGAREKVASILGARPEEIFFTSGGTESDNWAIKSALELRADKGKHIISTGIEHHAVLHTLQHLETQGAEVTYLPVNELGQIDLNDLRKAIRKDTVLITVMAANNEIGTILPVAEIGAVARESGVLFHTDAVQAVGHIPISTAGMSIDMLSLTAHKFKGPKGCGALYIRGGVRLPTLLHGGGHERGLRSGTENTAGIVGLAAALEEASLHMNENAKRVSAMRDRLIGGLTKIPASRLTGHPTKRLPGIASFVFEYIEGESIILLLDQAGICASSGSACSSASLEPSSVLLAIGLPHEIAHGSLRLSLSEDNSEEDIDYILEKLPPIIERLRSMSPLWDNKK
ncbi:MAG: cysteine desulfurase NifS [Peptococcaceae bacterium]|jgi:cysteine desulfurase|nr:cysteine desulfurase NifS [Peptococcaceae bacterium]